MKTINIVLYIMLSIYIACNLYCAADDAGDYKQKILEQFLEAQRDIQFDRPGALDRLQGVSVREHEELFKQLLLQASQAEGVYAQEYAQELYAMLSKKYDEANMTSRLVRTTSFGFEQALTILDIAIFAGNIEGVKEILKNNPDISYTKLFASDERRKITVEKALAQLIKLKEDTGKMYSGQEIKATLAELKAIESIIKEHVEAKTTKKSRRLSSIFTGR